MRQPIRLAWSFIFVCAFVLAAGCGSSSSGPVGGPVAGLADSHCIVNGVQMKTEIGMCVMAGSDAAVMSDDAGTSEDGGSSSADDGGSPSGDDGGSSTGTPMADCTGMQSGGGDFGATMCNSEGDDDDCKYHVAWSSSPIQKNANVTFTVKATRLIDGQPVDPMANVQIEAFLPPIHPTPTNDIPSTPTTAGTFTVGPLVFDVSGVWTVRFHLFESCIDSDDSPHGHAAFYIKVP
jgi:hypothetical protein